MATVQYLDIAGLQIYDGLIKGVISESEAKALKTVKIAGQDLKFYKTENPAADAVPDFKISLPQQDLSGLLEKISGGTEGNVVIIGAEGIVVDSGIALDDLATKTEVETVDTKVGDITTLKTANKTNAVVAINEVKDAVGSVSTNSAIEITTDSTSEGASKSYTVKQGGNAIAVIDIPKDMVVSNGVVETYTDETLPTGSNAPTKAGTYIILTIANATADKLYIPADKLVDVYKPEAGATQIQLSISSDNMISASVVAGSIGTTELTDGAVTTDKIADANVTLAKLSSDVQTSLGLADTAVQPDDIKSIPAADIQALFATTPKTPSE